jgi:glycerophosphoryl diester phosphodiesterase
MKPHAFIALALFAALLASTSSGDAAHATGPWVIAHRGASAEAPENTMAAFRLALADGADALEMDCQATADGHLVLVHDHTLDRTTDGRGPVGKMTLEAVKALDAGSWKSPRFAGERVPTLSEACRLAREAGVGMVVEAKTPYALDPTLARRVADDLEREGVLAVSVIQSFDHRPLAELHAARPDVKLAPLIDAGIDAVEPIVRAAGAWAYLPGYEFVLPDRVATLHRLGVAVCPWTVDDPEHMRRLIRAGVDGIITNRPKTLRRLIERLGLARRPWPR